MPDLETSDMPVAFLGLGLMGSPMSSRLTGVTSDLRVWNRSPGRYETLTGTGHRIAASARDAVEGAKIVFLCLTDERAVEAVLFGEDGIAPALSSDALIVDLSTIGPAPTHAMAARVKAMSGAGWVDAPVTGGVAGAVAGSLVILCGGNDADIDRIEPLFAALSRRVERLGPLGAGQVAKLCNQLIVSINVLAMSEALAIAEHHGIDPTLLPKALHGGWADSLPFQLLGPRIAEREGEPRVLAINTLGKDIRAARDSVAGAQLRTPVMDRAFAVYQAMKDVQVEDADIGLLLEVLARAALPRG